jgi:sodium/hydrogen antiporter
MRFRCACVGVGLPLTIVVGAVLAAAIFTELSVAEAVVLAVVLAPTDAALGQAVVSDPRLPSRIRQGLNVESGLNDGICVPLLLIALTIADVAGAGIATGVAAGLGGRFHRRVSRRGDLQRAREPRV